MKSRKLPLKIACLTLSVMLGATLVWWRVKVAENDRMPWLNPENHARILAEARMNGWVVAADHTDGTRYYFMGSSKYGVAIRADDLSQWDYRDLWNFNRRVPEGERGRGTGHMPSVNGRQKYETFHGEPVELELSVDKVAPGTTVEEILMREGK